MLMRTLLTVSFFGAAGVSIGDVATAHIKQFDGGPFTCYAKASGANCNNTGESFSGADDASQGAAIQGALNACSAAVSDPCVCSFDHCDGE